MKHLLLLFTMVILAGSQCVQAQSCTTGTLTGPYAYSARGFLVNGAFGQGLHVFSAAGKLTFDGQGRVNVKDTESIDGNVTRGQTFGGTYAVNNDCTGTITMFSPAAGVTVYDFAISGTGNEFTFAGAQDSANTTGSATKQTVTTVQ